MRSPLSRGSALTVAVAPLTLLPATELVATIEIPAAIDKVTAAKAELGYLNTFAYRWAGRADAAATAGADSLATIGEVGTDHGSERVTSEWVAVLATQLEAPDRTLSPGTHELAFGVPSWAPGSSQELVDWAVRLTVDRRGRDVAQEAGFAVLAPPPAPGALAPGPLERVMGGASDIDIRLDRPAWRAGETIEGSVLITAPPGGLPEADIAVVAQFDRLSHPLERTPARTVTFDRERLTVDGHAALVAGATTELRFALALAAGAPPTAEGVHSSLRWFLGVRILYRGFSANLPERVRRGFVVYNG